MSKLKRPYKIHLAVPSFGSQFFTLCGTKGLAVTTLRESITCNICKHFLEAYCDAHVIERGNAFARR